MSKVKFLSVCVLALAFMVGACDKDSPAPDVAGGDDGAMSVKGYEKLQPYGEYKGVPGLLGEDIAYSFNSIPAAEFAKFPTPPFNNFEKPLGKGVTVFRSKGNLEELYFDVGDEGWSWKPNYPDNVDKQLFGNGNDPVYLWFDFDAERDEKGLFYVAVRYRASNNVVFAFNVEFCALWCNMNGPISLDLDKVYGGIYNVGEITQVRLGYFEAEVAPKAYAIKFYKDATETSPYHHEIIMKGNLLLPPFLRAGFDGIDADYIKEYDGEVTGEFFFAPESYVIGDQRYVQDWVALGLFFGVDDCRAKSPDHKWLVKDHVPPIQVDAGLTIDHYAAYMKDGVLEVYPVWGDPCDAGKVKYTVEFYVLEYINNQWVPKLEDAQPVESGDPCGDPPTVSLDKCYALDGWYTDLDFTDKWDFDDPITSDIVDGHGVLKLYAEKVYSISQQIIENFGGDIVYELKLRNDDLFEVTYLIKVKDCYEIIAIFLVDKDHFDDESEEGIQVDVICQVRDRPRTLIIKNGIITQVE